MKIAYVFATSTASTFKLATMILPQLEEGTHGATVVGMFFSTTTCSACAKAMRSVSASRQSRTRRIFSS